MLLVLERLEARLDEQLVVVLVEVEGEHLNRLIADARDLARVAPQHHGRVAASKQRVLLVRIFVLCILRGRRTRVQLEETTRRLSRSAWHRILGCPSTVLELFLQILEDVFPRIHMNTDTLNRGSHELGVHCQLVDLLQRLTQPLSYLRRVV